MSTPTGTQLQIATDSGFSDILVDKSGEYSNLVSVNDSDFSIAPPKDTILYSRARHSGSDGETPWSDIVNFTILNQWKTIQLTNVLHTNAFNPLSINIIALNSSKVLICYRQGTTGFDNQYMAMAQILTINHTTNTITASSPINCATATISHINACMLTETKILICFKYTEFVDRLYVALLTVSGSTISSSEPVQVASINVTGISSSRLDDDRALFYFINQSTNNFIGGVVIDANGTTITGGSTCTIVSQSVNSYTSTLLFDGSRILLYVNNGLRVCRVDVNNLFITGNNHALCFTASIPTNFTLVPLYDKKFIVVTSIDTTDRYVFAKLVYIDDDNEFVISDMFQCNSVYSSSTKLVHLYPTKVMMMYVNGNNKTMHCQLLDIIDDVVIPNTAKYIDHPVDQTADVVYLTYVTSIKLLLSYKLNSDNNLKSMMLISA